MLSFGGSARQNRSLRSCEVRNTRLPSCELCELGLLRTRENRWEDGSDGEETRSRVKWRLTSIQALTKRRCDVFITLVQSLSSANVLLDSVPSEQSSRQFNVSATTGFVGIVGVSAALCIHVVHPIVSL